MPRDHVIDPSVVHHQWDADLEIRVPTLVTEGRRDEARPAHVAVLAERIAGSELVIFENSSHTAFIEEQASYLSVVTDFLARADAAAKAG
jgi:pimeloyl-ACP methyl ester carboxylesterase